MKLSGFNYCGKGSSGFDPAEERAQMKDGQLPDTPSTPAPDSPKCPVCGAVGMSWPDAAEPATELQNDTSAMKRHDIPGPGFQKPAGGVG